MSVYSVNKNDVLLMVLSVFLAPVTVWIRRGFFTRDFLLNFLLYILFFFPAIFHAAYVIYETSDERQSSYESVPNQEDGSEQQQQQLPGNGDFSVDLEAQGALPPYEEAVENSKAQPPTDNKIQVPG